MPKIAARDSYIAIDDIDGSLYILSQKLNSIALLWTSESPDVSSFGTGTRERLGDGIMDWEISLDGFSSADSDEVLSDLLSGSTVLVFTPGGKTSGSIIYSCSAVLTEYSTNLGVADMAPITAHLVACRNEPKRYLLLDTFSSNIIAGAVNGSYATDGINVRTGVDTESKLSIVGGVLNVAGGKTAPTSGDPGVWYPAQTRVAGKALFLRDTTTTFNSGATIGWDDNQSGASHPHGIVHLSPGTGFNNVSAFHYFLPASLGTEYRWCFVLRASGCFVFYRLPGELWMLGWIDARTNTATMYPGIANYDAVLTADSILIPAQLWLPVPIASDSFTRADGALGVTDGAGHAEANGGSGKAWVFDSGTWVVATNKAVGTPAAGSEVIVNGAFGADTDWTKGTGWAIATGVATATLASADLSQTAAPLVAGTWYLTSFAASSQTAGTVGLVLGSAANPTHNTNATFAETQRATGTGFIVRGVANTGSVDNVSAKPLTLSSLFSTVDAGNGDSIIDVKVAALLTGTQAGGVARLDSAVSPANFIIFYFDGAGNVKIDECIAGVYASLATAAKAFTADDILRLAPSGSAWRLYHITSSGTAVSIGSGTTNRTTGSLAGLFSTSASNTFSGFTNFPTGTGGEYASLDNLL